VNAQDFNQWEKNVQQPGAKHGLTATAITVLLLDATIVNILGKLHLKAAPILFYTVPISMPFSLFFSQFSIFVLFLLFILVYLVVLPLDKVLRKIEEPCKSCHGVLSVVSYLPPTLVSQHLVKGCIYHQYLANFLAQIFNYLQK
jgi:hypothetical protein